MCTGLKVQKACHSVSRSVDTVHTRPQDWYLVWNVLEIVTRQNHPLVDLKNAKLVHQIRSLINPLLLVANFVAVSYTVSANQKSLHILFCLLKLFEFQQNVNPVTIPKLD